ncbi:MAG: DUF58 domain-containing protein [bacterium]
MKSGFWRYSDELILLGVSLFLFLVASNTQAGWLYLLNSVLLGTLLAGFIISRFSIRGLEIERRLPLIACEGDTIRVTLRVLNKNRLASYFFSIEEYFPAASPEDLKSSRMFVFERLSGKTADSVTYEAECYKRGIYHFPPMRASAGAPIGFFNAMKTLKVPGVLTVLPTAPVLRDGHFSTARFESSTQNTARLRSGHSHDFFGIRQHQPGESTRMLHWPSVARTGLLMLKEFENPAGSQVFIFLDTNRRFHTGLGREASIEYAVKLATSVARHALLHGHTIRLMAARKGEFLALKTRDLLQALRWLAAVEADGEMENEQLFVKLNDEITRGSRLLLIQPESSINPELFVPLLDKKIKCRPLLLKTETFIKNIESMTPATDESRQQEVILLNRMRSLGLSPVVCGRGDDLLQCLRELGGLFK